MEGVGRACAAPGFHGLRAVALPRADASPEDLVGTQVLIHLVCDADAAGRWTTL